MDVRGTAACTACDDIILFRVAVLLCGVLLWLGFESYWLFIAWFMLLIVIFLLVFSFFFFLLLPVSEVVVSFFVILIKFSLCKSLLSRTAVQ